MLRFLADENFNDDIVTGLLLRKPDLDIVRASHVSLGGVDDPGVLDWAAENGRIVLSSDRSTMPEPAWQRVADGLPMPGLILLRRRLSVREAIEEILIIEECTEQEEWVNQVTYLPL